jgi:glycosyltransferase involved in cell wall biosynthesis
MMFETVLVIPCYNEESRWSEKYWADLAKIDNLTLLFVNDGSADHTGMLIDNFCDMFENAHALHLHSNAGKAEAVRQGFQYVFRLESQKVIWLGFLDADGCVSVAEVLRITTLVSKCQDFNQSSIWTSRIKFSGNTIDRKFARHIIGRSIAALVSFQQPGIPRDTQCGFKFFRISNELSRLLEAPFRTRWLFELEILERWRALNSESMKIHEEPLTYWKDIPGSKITLKQAPLILKEIVIIKWLQLSR